MNNASSEFLVLRGESPFRGRKLTSQKISPHVATADVVADVRMDSDSPHDGKGGRAAANAFVSHEALFIAHLPIIDDVVARVCRRHRLPAAEAGDFASDVRLHFVERDYEVLRRFEGRSSLRTYLNVVIQRLFLDHRNRAWGKWRPSVEAKRLGPVAMLLERLITRDGWSFDQAEEMLRTNYGVTSNEPLYAWYLKLSPRPSARQLLSEDEASAVPSSAPSPEANVLRAEAEFGAKRVETALRRARAALAPEDRLVLKMRFENSMPIADIARALHLNQKGLYRTIEQLLARIRQMLEAEGVSSSDVCTLFAESGLSGGLDPDVPNGAGRVLAPGSAEARKTRG